MVSLRASAQLALGCLLLLPLPVHSEKSAAFNPGKIISTASMNVPRSGHTATLLPDGTVLIAGGMLRNGDFTKTAEIYDPKTNKFVSTANMGVGRVGAAAVLLPSGRVLIVGGWRITAEAEIYDPKSRSFHSAGHMTERRARPTATLLKDGTVLITGGEINGDTLETTASAELFNEHTGQFSRVGSMHTGRAMHTATLLNDGRVLVAGGGTAREQVTNSAELYDPKSRSFLPLIYMAKARYKQTAVLLDDGTVLVAGGSDASDWSGAYDSAEIFNAATGRFTMAPATMKNGRFKLPAEAVRVGHDVVIFGGAPGVALYDEQSKNFVNVPGPAETERFYPSATALNDGRVLLAGGYPKHSDAATAGAWLYVAGNP